MSPEGAIECQQCPLGATPNETRTACNCLDQKTWSWSEGSKVGACMSGYSFLISIQNNSSILMLVCLATAGFLVLIILVVSSLLIHEKRKTREESLGPVKVVYNAEGNEPAVHIVDEERGVREQVELPVHSQVIVPEEATCRSEVEDSQGFYESENIYADLS